VTFPPDVQLRVRQRASGVCECTRNTCTHYGPCKARGAEFHHKKSPNAGGGDDAANCQLLCKACHLAAHKAADALGRL